MKYALPAGAHAVSARGREFIGDERGEIDLTDVDSGTVGDLVNHAGITFPKTDEEKAAAAALAALHAEFQAQVAAATAQAHADHLAALSAPKAEAALQAVVEAADAEAEAVQAATDRAALVDLPVGQQLTPANSEDELREADVEAMATANQTRSVTPPRRRKVA